MAEKNGAVPITFKEFIWSRAARHLAYCGVYAVGPDPDGPIKIGITTNPVSRFSALNTDNPVEIFCYHYCWFAGLPLAKRVEDACHKHLTGKNIKGEWFNISYGEASEVILRMAEETKSPWFDEKERLRRVEYLKEFST